MKLKWQWGQDKDDSVGFYGLWINELFWGIVEDNSIQPKKPKGFLWF